MSFKLDQKLKEVNRNTAVIKLKELWAERSLTDQMNTASLFIEHLKVAVLFLYKSRITSVLNILCIASILFMLGFMLALQSSDFLGISMQQEKLRFSVFVKDSATEAEWADLGLKIKSFPGVLETNRLDKRTALRELKSHFPADQDLFLGLEDDNPLPASLEVFFDLSASESLPVFAGQLKSVPFIEAVTYDGELAQIFSKLARTLNKPGKATTIALILLTVFLISSTVRLSMFHQQEQIEIMSLVGASMAFVKAPFVVGASLQALIAYIIAVISLSLLERAWSSVLAENSFLGSMSFNLPLTASPILSTVLLVALSSSLIGSYISARTKIIR